MNIKEMKGIIEERRQETETLNEQIRKAKFRLLWINKEIESLEQCIEEVQKEKVTDVFEVMLKEGKG
jgi:hypothetical protein